MGEEVSEFEFSASAVTCPVTYAGCTYLAQRSSVDSRDTPCLAEGNNTSVPCCLYLKEDSNALAYIS